MDIKVAKHCRKTSTALMLLLYYCIEVSGRGRGRSGRRSSSRGRGGGPNVPRGGGGGSDGSGRDTWIIIALLVPAIGLACIIIACICNDCDEQDEEE